MSITDIFSIVPYALIIVFFNVLSFIFVGKEKANKSKTDDAREKSIWKVKETCSDFMLVLIAGCVVYSIGESRTAAIGDCFALVFLFVYVMYSRVILHELRSREFK